MFWVPIISLLLAPLFCWFLSRRLLKRVNSPLLAEQIQAFRGHVMLICGLLSCLSSAIVSTQIGNEQAIQNPILIPLFLLSLFAHYFAGAFGAWRVKKQLLGDRQNVFLAVFNDFRMSIGYVGFGFFLLVTPFLIAATASPWIWAGLAVLILLTWSLFNDRFLVMAVGGQLLKSEIHQTRFREIIEVSRLKKVSTFVFGSSKGVFANAFALPSLNRDSVLFSQPLLDQLTVEEATAIYAHEVGHLEEFNEPEHIRKRWFSSILAISAGVLAPISQSLVPNHFIWLLYGWFIMLLILAWAFLMRQQGHETASDKRAIELCGDGQALIDALTKLHETNHMPRRMQAEAERISTHPSLARRIADIKSLMGQVSEPITDESFTKPTQVLGQNEGTIIILDQHRLEIYELEPEETPGLTQAELREKALSIQVKAYRDLVEIRVIQRGKKTLLRLVDQKNQVTEIAILNENLEDINRKLDQIDLQLAPLNRNAVQGWMIISALIVGFAGFFANGQGALTGGVLYLLITTVIAVLFRSKAWMVAHGTMGLFAVFYTFWLQADKSWWPFEAWLSHSLMLFAAIFLLFKSKDMLEPDIPNLPKAGPRGVALTLCVTAFLFLLPAIWFMIQGEVFQKCFGLAQHAPGRFLPFAGAGFALLQLKGSKLWGSFWFLLGLIPFLVTSEWYLKKTDEMAQAMDKPEFETGSFQPQKSIQLDGNYWGLQLAEDGHYFSLVGNDEQEDYEFTFLLANFKGQQNQIKALDLTFVPDQLLVLKENHGQSILSLRSLEHPEEVIWSLDLEISGADQPDLVFLEPNWRIVAGASNEKTILIEGQILVDEFVKKTFAEPTALERTRHFGFEDQIDVIRGSAPRGKAFSPERFRWIFLNFYYPTRVINPETNESILFGSLWTDLLEPKASGDPYYLICHGRKQAWFWHIQNGQKTAWLQMVKPHRWSWDGTSIASAWRNALTVVNVHQKTGIRISLPFSVDWSYDMAIQNDHLVMACPNDQGTEIVQISFAK